MKTIVRKLMLCALCLALVFSVGCVGPTQADAVPAQAQPSSEAQQNQPVPAEPPQAASSAPEESAPPLAPNEAASSAPAPPAVEPPPAPPAVMETLYSWNPADYTYHRISDNKEAKKLFSTLQGLKEEPNERILAEGTEKLGFVAQMTDGTTYKYMITTKQIYIDKTVLEVSDRQRGTLLKTARQMNANHPAIPQWLGLMSLARITNVSFDGMNGSLDERITFDTGDKAAIKAMGDTLRTLVVEPDSVKIIAGKVNADTAEELLHARLKFDSGVTYDILGGDTLTLMSSDMDFSLEYTMSGEAAFDKLRAVAQEIQYGLTGTAPKQETEAENSLTTPEKLLEDKRFQDFFIMDETVQMNASDTDWVMELEKEKGKKLGVINRSGMKTDFKGWDATALPTGTVIYEFAGEKMLTLAETKTGLVPYMKFVEG